MIIKNLQLNHYRNHESAHVDFAPGINLITGPNGAGKTNLIDAIHFLCMSRSFVTRSDTYVIMQGRQNLEITAQIEGGIRSSFSLSCSFSRGEGKKFRVNDSPLDRLADLIGIVPVVVLSPDDRRITNEGPAERRTFLDSMISQTSKRYLSDLMEYRKIIRQRNRLLSGRYPDPAMLKELLEPWNIQLVRTGARIIAKRCEVLESFAEYLEQGYARISGIKLKPSFEYKTICEPVSDPESVEKAFESLLEEQFDKEFERQMTLQGPHRDDLVFYLDDMELRKFGSQGQHRLFALALKLAELHYFSDLLDDLPVFLLDDVFGDLDPGKIRVLTDMLNNHPGQAFITAANESPFEGLISFENGRNKRFKVEPGPVLRELS